MPTTLTRLAIAAGSMGLTVRAAAQHRSVVLPDSMRQTKVIVALPADPNAINHASYYSAAPGLTNAAAASRAGTDLIIDAGRPLSQVFGTVGGRFSPNRPATATAAAFFPIVQSGPMPQMAGGFGIDYDS